MDVLICSGCRSVETSPYAAGDTCTCGERFRDAQEVLAVLTAAEVERDWLREELADCRLALAVHRGSRIGSTSDGPAITRALPRNG